MRKYKMALSVYQTLLCELYTILRAVNREEELNRLAQWAKRKRLARPLRLYENWLADEKQRILRYRMNSPRLVSLAYLVHRVIYGVFPPPEFYRKGAAEGYNSRKC